MVQETGVNQQYKFDESSLQWLGLTCIPNQGNQHDLILPNSYKLSDSLA